MSKLSIKGIENYDTVHRYIIKKEKNMDVLLCNLLDKLGFSEDSILKVDIVFDDLDNDYIYVSENRHEIHIFVTKKYINLVIKTYLTQKKLNGVLKEFFDLPK